MQADFYVYEVVEGKIDGRFDPRSQCLSAEYKFLVGTLDLK